MLNALNDELADAEDPAPKQAQAQAVFPGGLLPSYKLVFACA